MNIRWTDRREWQSTTCGKKSFGITDVLILLVMLSGPLLCVALLVGLGRWRRSVESRPSLAPQQNLYDW